jgi:hypothetical protein
MRTQPYRQYRAVGPHQRYPCALWRLPACTGSCWSQKHFTFLRDWLDPTGRFLRAAVSLLIESP